MSFLSLSLLFTMHIPDLVTWSVCPTRANPVEFDHEKSREALCTGRRWNFSKDELESGAHNAARKSQQSCCESSGLEVRGRGAEEGNRQNGASPLSYNRIKHTCENGDSASA